MFFLFVRPGPPVHAARLSPDRRQMHLSAIRPRRKPISELSHVLNSGRKRFPYNHRYADRPEKIVAVIPFPC
jgi:hypothetical protein